MMSSDAFWGAIAVIFASNGFWTWLGGRKTKGHFAKNKEDMEEQKMLIGAMAGISKAEGRRMLKHDCKKFERLGYIPSNEYDEFVETFENYKSLNGNGATRKRCEETLQLPIKE